MSTTTNELFSIPESRRPDRFFVAKNMLYVVHSDNTVCIAMMPGPVTIESTETLLAELRQLMA